MLFNSSICVAPDGARLACTTFGDGPPAALLISSWTTTQQQLQAPASAAFYDGLASRLKVVTYDRRGVGASSRDVGDLSMDAQVGDLAAVLDAANVSSSDIVADNDACYIAAHFAALHPERVRRLVLWSPFVSGQDARPSEMREFAELMRRDYVGASRRRAERLLPAASDEEKRASAELFASQRSATVTADYMEWEAGEDVSTILPRIAAPTLVLAPRRLGSRSMGVASLIPNSRFETVDADPATGVLDLADVARRITDFLG